MKLKYIKNGECDDLKANIRNNIDRYESNSQWLADYFEGDNWFRESKYHMPDNVPLKMPEGKKFFDFENTKIIYEAFKDIPLSVAIDERFWSYLTHVTFWEYMRKRWPVENGKKTKKGPISYLTAHYFFLKNKDRALIRNGISRLWWYGHLTYDVTRNDHFELTEVLLTWDLDIAQGLLERRYSRYETLTRTILSLLVEKKADGEPFSERSKFRALLIYLNALGGVTILDALNEGDIRNIVEIKLEQLKTENIGNNLDETPSEEES